MRPLILLACLIATTAYGIDIAKVDIDGDGRISKAEAAGNAELMDLFDRADRDRDGRLTSAEIEAHEKRMKARAAKAASASAGGSKPKAKTKVRKD
jgi:hypothetical protein